MKRRTKKWKTEDNFSQPPPWANCKTKSEAWREGFLAGGEESKRIMDRQKPEFSEQEKAGRLQALRDVCQAGSIVLESMSKALLAYERVL
jgi:hypothetical protein